MFMVPASLRNSFVICLFDVFVCFVCMGVYASYIYIYSATGSQKRVSAPLRLELKTGMSFHVGTET